MYLQITTKCNFRCAHCCYSCNNHGKHMDYNTAIDAITFARDTFGDESISIGGGEPTLHPRFFDILRHCLNDFDYVWMATNGSKEKKMWRLVDIIEGEDYDHEDEENYSYQSIDGSNGKLCVALSYDHFHRSFPINEKVVAFWKRNAEKHRSGYEIRDITQGRVGVIKQGRAIRTQVWQTEGECVCETIMIKPDGSLRLCGCTKSPVIGDIWYGIKEKWQRVINYDEGFREAECYRRISGVDDQGRNYNTENYGEEDESERILYPEGRQTQSQINDCIPG